MTDLNNKLNINIPQTFPQGSPKEKHEIPCNNSPECGVSSSKANEEALQKGEILGRTMVNKLPLKSLSQEALASLNYALKLYKEDPELFERAMKAMDHLTDLGESYEEACCTACDYLKCND